MKAEQWNKGECAECNIYHINLLKELEVNEPKQRRN